PPAFAPRFPYTTLFRSNIAVEAFGRPAEFDKRRDSIVRVEAHRLRKRLIQFYEQEAGADHEVRIDIPPGQYAPVFIRRIAEPETDRKSTRLNSSHGSSS